MAGTTEGRRRPRGAGSIQWRRGRPYAVYRRPHGQADVGRLRDRGAGRQMGALSTGLDKRYFGSRPKSVSNLSRDRRELMRLARAISGHVFRVDGKRRSVWRAKYRLPDGRQVLTTIEPVWTERGRPPEGYLTKRTARRGCVTCSTRPS